MDKFSYPPIYSFCINYCYYMMCNMDFVLLFISSWIQVNICMFWWIGFTFWYIILSLLFLFLFNFFFPIPCNQMSSNIWFSVSELTANILKRTQMLLHLYDHKTVLINWIGISINQLHSLSWITHNNRKEENPPFFLH